MKNTIKYLTKDKVDLPKMTRLEIALSILGLAITGTLILKALL